MSWTEITRAQHDRRSLRYTSDCTDGEWALVASFMPKRSKVGRPRRTRMRAVWNAIQYYFYKLRDSGVLDLMNEALASAARLVSGRSGAPTAGVIDSQSVKTTESGGPRGYDAGKKIKGRKRHIVTDTDGNLLAARVHTALIQDRDGAAGVIGDAKDSFPSLAHLFADGGYAGDKLEVEMIRTDGPVIEIVRRPGAAKGFVVIARRWVVERTLAWFGRCRRLSKDWETSIASSEAWPLTASIRRLSRRVARQIEEAREI